MTSRNTKYWDIGTIPLIAPEKLVEIVTNLADVAIVITENGQILSVLANPVHNAHAKLEIWENANIRDFLCDASIPKFDKALSSHLKDNAAGRLVELNHSQKNKGVEFPIVYTLHSIGPNGAILMLGRDLQPISELQQHLVDAQIALERDYELQREFDTRYRVLMQATNDAMVFVSVSTGKIIDANGAAAALLGRTGDELKDTGFAQAFEYHGRSELMADMAALALSEGLNPITLIARESQRRLRAKPSFFRAAGSRMMLCRLDTEAQGSDPDMPLNAGLAGLFMYGPDAIVFTNREGVITAANEAFLGMTDAAHGMVVRGRSLADFLNHGVVDLKVLLENTVRTGRLRMFPTGLKGQFNSRRSIEISATYLADSEQPSLVFVMRETGMGEAARSKSSIDAGPERSRSVIDLVGSTTLKEIVADTTDVIEKMCIETAIELTSNNRVAAAEMLGLSRQSLYVKLRKFGLLTRMDDD